MALNVLVIGDAILDHFINGHVERMSPEDSTVPVVDVDKEEYRLGGCLNVAANIRSIGRPKWRSQDPYFNVYLSSIYSRFTGNMLLEKGILSDDSCIIGEDRAGTLLPSPYELIKTRVVHNNKQIVRIDNRKKYRDLDIKLYNEVIGDIKEDFYDAVVVSDYGKGLIGKNIFSKLKNFNNPVFVDSKNPSLNDWINIPNCFVKCNSVEFKKSYDKGFGLKRLIVTKGELGCTLYEKNGLERNEKHFSVQKVQNPDVVGCGDVFLAGFVVNYMRHKDLNFAIEFANMCAGKSAKKPGTTEVYL